MHWLRFHKSKYQPFQFQAIALAGCFNCKEVGTCHNLIQHHKEHHPSKEFTIVDRIDPKKCGICNLKADDLIDHFKTKHKSVTRHNYLNPISYSQERIHEFLSIDLQQNMNSNRKKLSYLICGFCKQKVDCDKYLKHFSEHKWEFKCLCLQCVYRSADLDELVLHEKIAHNIQSLDHHCSQFKIWIKNKLLDTSLVFGNGLIVKYMNVVGTTFDKSVIFEEFITGIIKKIREKVKKKLGITIDQFGTDGNLNRGEKGRKINIDAV